MLSETIGKVPALQRVLTKEVQMEVFPLLKPCLYAAGEVVYKRGDPSDALLFLLEGQVSAADCHGRWPLLIYPDGLRLEPQPSAIYCRRLPRSLTEWH